jgi:hypothetical protein
MIKTYDPYTKILNFILLIWEERNLGRYEHARACRERARGARETNPPAAFTTICLAGWLAVPGWLAQSVY